MKPIAFVTGATGFVGNAVARALLKKGREVRVLARKTSNLSLLKGLPIEIIPGDLRQPDSLLEAIRGCKEVYHVAAQYTFYNPNPDEIYANNVQGTHNVLLAAMKASVPRVVYTSTVGAIGIPKDGSYGDETTPITLQDCNGHYKRSKFLAEQEAFSFFRKGLPVVIVNPSAPIGEGDAKPTPTGRMIVEFLNRRMPAYLDTGLNLIDVEDVAVGHILAAEKGKGGERYILGNKNLHLGEIFRLLSEMTGLKAPKIKMPHFVALVAAHASELIAKWTKSPPRIEKEAVQLAKKRMFFKCDKAVRELSLPQPPIPIALKKSVNWYVEHGYINEKISKQLKDNPRLVLES